MKKLFLAAAFGTFALSAYAQDPSVSAFPANNTTDTGTTFNAVINPSDTLFWGFFKYGPGSFTQQTPTQFYDTTNNQFIMECPVINLTCNTLYIFLPCGFNSHSDTICASSAYVVTTANCVITQILEASSDDFNISPNPGTDISNVVAGARDGMLTVYDATGRSVAHIQIVAGNGAIDTRALLPGIYIAVMYNTGGMPMGYQKLIIQ